MQPNQRSDSSRRRMPGMLDSRLHAADASWHGDAHKNWMRAVSNAWIVATHLDRYGSTGAACTARQSSVGPATSAQTSVDLSGMRHAEWRDVHVVWMLRRNQGRVERPAVPVGKMVIDLVRQYVNYPHPEEWFRDWGTSAEQWRQSVLPRVQRVIRPGAAVLEIGCWYGRFAGLILDAGCSYYGVDHNQECCDGVIRTYPQARATTWWPPAGERFDLILSWNALTGQDREVVRKVLHGVAEYLTDDGMALIHHSSGDIASDCRWLGLSAELQELHDWPTGDLRCWFAHVVRGNVSGAVLRSGPR